MENLKISLVLLAAFTFFASSLTMNAQYGSDLEAYQVLLGEYYPEGQFPLTIYFKNNGPGSVQSMKISWSINGGPVQERVVEEIGAVASSSYIQSLTIEDGFTIEGSATNQTLQVWMSEPDGEIDPNSNNNYFTHNIQKLDAACEKVILLESHMGVDNSFGPDVELQLDSLLNEHSDRIIVASLHTFDDMEIDLNHEIIVSQSTGFDMYYSEGLIDRFLYPASYIGENNKPNQDREDWDELLALRWNNFYSPVHLSTSNTYNYSTRELVVDIDAQILANLTGDYRFNCYILEDPVTGPGVGFAQINRYSYEGPASGGPDHPYYPYPSLIEGFEHRNVVRDMLGGAWGTSGSLPYSMNAGQTYSHQFTYTLPDHIDPNQAKLVILMQEYDANQYLRPILNSVACNLNTSNQNDWIDGNSSQPFVASFSGKIYLEGAYTGNGQMETSLTATMPYYQPYNVYPYYYYGSESLSSIPYNMVDWVLVEARSGTPNLNNRNTTTVETQAAVLLSDGSIVSPNGQSAVAFYNLQENQQYHFAVRHRNHLDVLTGSSVVAYSNFSYDFTTDVNKAFGSEQLKPSYDGKYMMFAGDFNQDGTIQVTDIDMWKAAPAALNVYSNTDGSMDGSVQLNDYDIWFPNKAKLGTAEINY